MSDEIQPALMRAEWEYRAKGGTDPWFDDDYKPRSQNHCARTIAIANAALSDSDPRKITRERLDRAFNTQTGDDDTEAFLRALESYLPPRDL